MAIGAGCEPVAVAAVVAAQQSEGELDLREQYLERLRELVTLQLRWGAERRAWRAGA